MSTLALERAWLLNGDVTQIWRDIEEGLETILNMLTSDKVEIVPITTMDNALSGVIGVQGATITKADLTVTMYKGRGGGLRAQVDNSHYFKFQHLQGCTNWLQLGRKAVVRMQAKEATGGALSISHVGRVLDDVRLWIISAKDSFSEINFYSLSKIGNSPGVFSPALPSSMGVTFNIDQANLITTVFRLHQVSLTPGKDMSRLLAIAETPEAHQIGGLHFIKGHWYEVVGVKVVESMVPSLINTMSSLQRVLEVTQRALLKINALR